MKVLIVNYSDKGGGAARAAFRLHEALIEQGVDSNMLVNDKVSNRIEIVGPRTKFEKTRNKIALIIDNLRIRKYKKRETNSFSVSKFPFSKVVEQIEEINPDIIHLHWTNLGMITIEDISKLKKPIVWSLHDMWAFTGGCHYDDHCGAYVQGCGSCKVLKSSKKKDLSYRTFNRKVKAYKKLDNLNIVGLSSWLAECARKSFLFKNVNVYNLPNPINIDEFKPIQRKIARELLGLDLDVKLILFGAMDPTSDKRKGFVYLSKALMYLNISADLVVIGSDKESGSVINSAFKTTYMGFLHDNISLRLLYSAADVMVVPSIQENLGNVIMESLACGTPVVGFNIGGNKDMVIHKENGYLAKPFDEKDLAEGISWVLSSENEDELRMSARNKVVSNFSYDIVSKKYIELYNNLLKA